MGTCRCRKIGHQKRDSAPPPHTTHLRSQKRNLVFRGDLASLNCKLRVPGHALTSPVLIPGGGLRLARWGDTDSDLSTSSHLSSRCIWRSPREYSLFKLPPRRPHGKRRFFLRLNSFDKIITLSSPCNMRPGYCNRHWHKRRQVGVSHCFDLRA